MKISERGYFPAIDDDELSLVLFRSQEIGYAASAYSGVSNPMGRCVAATA